MKVPSLFRPVIPHFARYLPYFQNSIRSWGGGSQVSLNKEVLVTMFWQVGRGRGPFLHRRLCSRPTKPQLTDNKLPTPSKPALHKLDPSLPLHPPPPFLALYKLSNWHLSCFWSVFWQRHCQHLFLPKRSIVTSVNKKNVLREIFGRDNVHS